MKTFSTIEDIPRCTLKGFDVIKCPAEVWNIIHSSYQNLQNFKKEESFPGIEDFIVGNENPDLFSFDNMPEERTKIHNLLLKIHEDWSNQELIPSYIYGIRSYKKGSTLANHKDRIRTHHISAIIIVDRDLGSGKDWPLDIQDHGGNWHKVYAQPGDMILYESAICEHGRNETFEGEYFRNFYVHYRLKNYTYTWPDMDKNINT